MNLKINRPSQKELIVFQPPCLQGQAVGFQDTARIFVYIYTFQAEGKLISMCVSNLSNIKKLQMRSDQNPCDIPLYWSVDMDPYFMASLSSHRVLELGSVIIIWWFPKMVVPPKKLQK